MWRERYIIFTVIDSVSIILSSSPPPAVIQSHCNDWWLHNPEWRFVKSEIDDTHWRQEFMLSPPFQNDKKRRNNCGILCFYTFRCVLFWIACHRCRSKHVTQQRQQLLCFCFFLCLPYKKTPLSRLHCFLKLTHTIKARWNHSVWFWIACHRIQKQKKRERGITQRRHLVFLLS